MIVQTRKTLKKRNVINKRLDNEIASLLDKVNFITILTYVNIPEEVIESGIRTSLNKLAEEGKISCKNIKIVVTSTHDDSIDETTFNVHLRVSPKDIDVFTYYDLSVELIQVSLRDFME